MWQNVFHGNKFWRNMKKPDLLGFLPNWFDRVGVSQQKKNRATWELFKSRILDGDKLYHKLGWEKYVFNILIWTVSPKKKTWALPWHSTLVHAFQNPTTSISSVSYEPSLTRFVIPASNDAPVASSSLESRVAGFPVIRGLLSPLPSFSLSWAAAAALLGETVLRGLPTSMVVLIFPGSRGSENLHMEHM